MESVFPGSATRMFIGYCQTYSCYFWLKEAFEIFFFSIFVLGVLWLIIACFSWCIKQLSCDCLKPDGCCQFSSPQCSTEPLVRFVFGSVLKEHNNENGEKEYTIFNSKAPQCYKTLLFSNVLQLLGIALMQFWDTFLLEESRICTNDPSLACFPATSYISLDIPRLDCSNTSYLEENKITSFNCYRFVFKLGPATGSAVGIVTTTTFIIKYIVPLMLLKLPKESKCRIFSTILIQVLLAMVTLLLTGFMAYLRYSISYSLLELLNAIRYLPIGCIILINIWFPWWKFEMKKDNKAETEITDEPTINNFKYESVKLEDSD